jgi:two-component system cell cycle sensor histidine kinase/response regulator CckA
MEEHPRHQSSLSASDYRLIVENAAEGIWMIDREARTTYVNQRLTDMLGYTAAEMLGRNPLSFIGADQRASAEASFEALSSGVGGQLEFVLERKDDVALFVLVSGTPLYDERGSFAGGLALVADITPRKLAEQRLAAQQAITEVLAESSSIAEATPRLLRAVCDATGWVLGQVWLADRKADVLRFSEGWYADGFEQSAFAAASREVTIERGAGILGRVWERGEPDWVVDLPSHPEFMRSEAAAHDRLKTMLAFPVGSQHHVWAVVELASRVKREIDAASLELTRNANSQIGQFIRRRSAEEQLRKSEKRFRALFDSAGVGVVLLDPERRVVECNDVYAAMLGYDPDRLRGVRLSDLTHPDDEPLSHRSYGSLLTGEVPFTRFEKRFVRPDGEIVWTKISGAPIAEPSPGSEFVVAIAEDITERKRAEENLRASEARLAEAQRIAHIGSWTWEIAGDRVAWSDELLRIYGLEREEFEGTYDAFLERVHPDDRARVEQIVRSAYETGQPYAYDHRIVRPDGEVRALHAEGEVIVGEDGTPVRMAGIGHDITERVEAQQKLDEAAARYRSLVERIPLVTYVDPLRPNAASVYVSPQIASLLGYSVEEWQSDGDLFRRILHPDDFERVPNWDAYSADDTAQLEYRVFARDGRVVWLRDEFVVAAGEEGEPVLEGFLLDITKRKQAEEQLRDSEARFRAIFESAAVGMALIDPERRILLTNPAFEEMVGYSKDELNGKSFTDLTYPDDEPRSREIVPKLTGGGRDVLEKRYVRKGGGVVWVRVTAAPVVDVAGDLQFAVGIIENINERKLAEARLGESEERYGTLIETARDALVSIDEDSVIVGWNHQAEKLFGWSKEEALGRSMPELIMPAKYRAAHDVGMRRFLESGEERVLDRVLEFSAVDRKGREFPVELTIWPTKAGESWQFNSFVRDMRERKKLEEQLRQAQKMDAVGRLASGVAHDFNNLLLAIRGYSELATAELAASGDHETARASIAQIAKATERAGALTRQLLAFGRKQVLIPRVVDLNRLIADDESLLRGVVGDHVELELSLDGKPCPVKVDPGQLDQVIMNIAINGGDSMPGGGRLTISTKRRKLSRRRVQPDVVLEPGPCVELEIRDTGIGMDEETLGRIFEPFFTTKPGGTGLGLSTVYGIVAQSGGQIDVESELWQGSLFRILLPEAGKIVDDEPLVQTLGSAPGSATILVVEDEEAVLDLVVTMLERLGYSVLRAATPEEALRVSAEHDGEIDLLLSDVVLPGGNGNEVAAAVVRQRPDVVVLFMSGYADPGIADAWPVDGDRMFLRKPFGSEELARKVRSALESRAQRVEGAPF